jgi:hypothetical protein
MRVETGKLRLDTIQPPLEALLERLGFSFEGTLLVESNMARRLLC